MSKMSSIPPIPSDCMTNILTRLPVKSLLRFRCVSKSFCAEIDDPYFIDLHLNHSLSTGANYSPIAISEGTLYSLNSDSLDKLEKTEIPLVSKTSGFNTCRGLLLLEANNGRLILFNPSTRKHTVLPTPPPDSKYDDSAIAEWYNCLGYDVINDDYKVFVIEKFVDPPWESIVTYEAHIYSLKSNLWHTVKDFAKGNIYDCDFKAFVNGALHTVSFDKDYILALDVKKEDFNIMPLPVEDKIVRSFDLHVFYGCLAVSCRYIGDRTDIWVMKEYGVKGSWSMLLSVKPENPNPRVLPNAVPIVYSKCRTKVLLWYDRHKLVWYDLRDGTVWDFEVDGVPTGFDPMVCVESLVSVTGKICDKKKRHGEEKMKVETVKMKRDSQ